jgi:hypothetical protein
MELYRSGDCAILSNETEFDNTFIFNTNKYYQIHKTNKSLRLILSYKFEPKAIINIVEENNRLKSPIKATFGGFEAIGKFDLEIFNSLLKTFNQFIQKKYNNVEILITQPPFFYNKNQSVITNLLLNNKFSISGNELNHFTNIGDNSLLSKMNKTSKKKYNRLNKLDLIFESSKNFQLSYNLLWENRKKRGIKISMQFDSILQMLKTFPSKTFFFDLKYRHDIISSAFCVSITDNVLYVLYWGHDSKYDDLSPIVFLSNSIFDFAKNKGFKVLDIGTSSVNGKIDIGLTRFKDSIGFSSDLKFTLSQKLNS